VIDGLTICIISSCARLPILQYPLTGDTEQSSGGFSRFGHSDGSGGLCRSGSSGGVGGVTNLK